MSERSIVKFRSLLLCIAFLVVVTSSAALAQNSECEDPGFRQSVVDLAASGASEDEVAEFVQQNCKGTENPTSKGLTVINNGNVFFEQLNACGYHPQAEMLSCDVQLKQNGGYGFFPAGSTERGVFCMDCNQDGIFEFITGGFVHVTDNISGQAPVFQFEMHATTFGAPLACTVGDGGVTNARAILSWQIPPPFLPGFFNCTVPAGIFFWGNTVDFMVRRDP